MIRFVCPHCKKSGEVDDRAAGSAITCPACGRWVQLPAIARPVAIPVAQPAAGVPADEDEAKLRAELPDAFFPGTEQLGRPRYRVERQVLHHKAYNPVAALVLCCIPCFIAVVAPGVYLLPRLVCLLFIAGFITGAVLYVRYLRRLTKIYVVAWTGGFVHFDGRQFHIWRWADIAALNMQGVDQRTFVLFIETDRLLTKDYRLRHRDGYRYQFWSTQGVRAGQFGRVVEQETYRLMMPDAVGRLNAGQSVPFQPFEVRANGLAYQGQLTPWADLRPARFERGRLILEDVGPTRSRVSILLGKIDNAHVFLKLLEQNVGFEDEE